MKAAAAAGFNVVMAKESQIPVCAKYKIKVLVMPDGSSNAKGGGVEPEVARRLAGNPAIFGYFLHDEPKDESVITGLAPAYQALREAAPSRLVYVNLAVGPKNLYALIRILHPQMISYDWYQWWYGKPANEKRRQAAFYATLERYRAAALQEGVPLLTWVEASSNSGAGKGVAGSSPAENGVCLRQSVYSNLAYGSKGIQWFNAKLVFKRGSPELSACGLDVAALNAEIGKLGPTLLQLRSTEVFHTAPAPASAKVPSDNAAVRSATPDLIIGLFQHERERGRIYAMVVNKGIIQAQDAALELKPAAKSVRRLDKQTGKWVPLAAGAALKLSLAPGDGELLEIRH
jgi:hypothetical protein